MFCSAFSICELLSKGTMDKRCRVYCNIYLILTGYLLPFDKYTEKPEFMGISF